MYVIITLLSGDHFVSVRHHYKDEISLNVDKSKTLYIDMDRENLSDRGLDYYSVFGKEIICDNHQEICYLHPSFTIKHSDTENVKLELFYSSVIPDFDRDNRYDREYRWELNDTILLLSDYLKIDEEDIWMLPGLMIILYIPDRQVIRMDDDIRELVKMKNNLPDDIRWDYDVPLHMKNNELVPLRDNS